MQRFDVILAGISRCRCCCRRCRRMAGTRAGAGAGAAASCGGARRSRRCAGTWISIRIIVVGTGHGNGWCTGTGYGNG